jgi:hypothetical protein
MTDEQRQELERQLRETNERSERDAALKGGK